MDPDKINEVLAALEKASAAGFALARELAKARGDDDEWSRLPSTKSRCKVSGWSRSTILRHIQSNAVRTKTRGTSRFYSLADVRKMLAEPPAPTGKD